MQTTPKVGGRYKRHADGQIVPAGKAPAEKAPVGKRAAAKTAKRRRGTTTQSQRGE